MTTTALSADQVGSDRLTTISMISEVIRDVAVLKRDLLRDLSCDVPAGAITVLSIVQREGPVRVGEVADRLGIDLSVASRHATTLEGRGLVQRRLCELDRRAHEVLVTEHGRDVLSTARADIARRLEATLGAWSAPDLRSLAQALSRLRADLSPALGTSGELSRGSAASLDAPAGSPDLRLAADSADSSAESETP